LRFVPAALRCALLLGVSLCFCAHVAQAATVVEVERATQDWVDGALARRLVVLELSDVDVPAPLDAQTKSRSPGLYVRILEAEDRLVVELWDRGELQGQRRLSLSGSPPLMARRIALAAGELARRLRERRLTEARAHKRRLQREEERRRRPQFVPIWGRPFLRASASVAVTTGGKALVFGPQLVGGLRLHRGPELAVGVGLFTGPLTDIAGDPWLEWYEVQLRPSYPMQFDWGTLRVGPLLSVASVHLVDASRDEAGRHSETWSGKAALDVAWAWRLGGHRALEVGVEAGALLRRVPVISDGQRGDLQGLWGAASLALTFP